MSFSFFMPVGFAGILRHDFMLNIHTLILETTTDLDRIEVTKVHIENELRKQLPKIKYEFQKNCEKDRGTIPREFESITEELGTRGTEFNRFSTPGSHKDA